MLNKESVSLKKVMEITFLFANICVLMSCTTEKRSDKPYQSNDDTANAVVSTTETIHQVKDTIDIDSKKNLPNGKDVKEWLVGHWFMPHSAFIYIDFNSDSTFIFMDYNIDLEASEKLTGKYSIDGNKLYLNYNDRKSQTFALVKGKSEYESYIKKGDDYYFVKSHR